MGPMPQSVPRRADRDREGFALAMVVLLLFAVAVAGATGYQLVSAEAQLSSATEEAAEALSVARAGLQRYVGEHIGPPGDTVAYLIGDGSVSVTQRRIADTDSDTGMYLLEAVGQVADPRHPESPARRTVRQYARLREMPANDIGAVLSVATVVRLRNPATVTGLDNSTTAQCPEGGTTGVYGVVNRGSANPMPGTTLAGSPAQTLAAMSVGELLDSAGVRWSALQDPDFPVPHDGDWPDFTSMPTDSVPVIRVHGNFVGTTANSGWGALIVTGDFTIGGAFSWNGIILAGSSSELESNSTLPSTIQGTLMTGLDGVDQTQLDVRYTTIQYNHCNVRRANAALAHFELVDGTRWEF